MPCVLPCNGALYSVNEFLELFDVIGATYGGDGVKTFAVPKVGSPPGLDHHSYFICSLAMMPYDDER